MKLCFKHMKLCLKKSGVPHNIVINELCVLHTISWNYRRKKKQGFLFVKRNISLSFQHTGTIRALFVPVLLRITHHLKTGVLVSSPNLYSPCLRFIYDWKPYCYSTVSINVWFTPCQFSIYISPLSISQKKVVSFTKYWRQKSWKVPQRKETCRGGRANSTSFLRFLYGWIDQSHDVTYGSLWHKWQNWKFVAKSRTRVYFAQHRATTCKTKICCVTSWAHRW